jgi:flagellar basal-body rod protein FlgF
MAYDISQIASAMDQKIMQLDQITNNLANAATPGFKAQHLFFLKTLVEENTPSATSIAPKGLVVDFAAGFSQKTDNPLDLQLQGDGFFVVQKQEGQAFTRKGDFTINKLKQLVTQEGDPVIGDAGPITLQGGKIHVTEEGAVFSDGSQVGKIKVVDFTDRKNLSREGNGLYRDDGTAGMKKIEKPNIASGFIELSNVNVVKEMTEMIDINRSFETYQKLIQTLSDQDKLSTSRIGRIT